MLVPEQQPRWHKRTAQLLYTYVVESFHQTRLFKICHIQVLIVYHAKQHPHHYNGKSTLFCCLLPELEVICNLLHITEQTHSNIKNQIIFTSLIVLLLICLIRN